MNVVVFGAGGRAGRAVTVEALARGYRVTAVVRDPDRHRHLAAERVDLVRGDLTDAARVAELVPGHVAAVHAVSPFSGPEQGFADLDPEFFAKAADALVAGLSAAGVPRLVVVGLFADLVGGDGRPVMDDPAAFPAEIRPFALAHTAGLTRLREHGAAVDWVVLTPPARLGSDSPRIGGYRAGGDGVPPETAHLSYADLAIAVVDEIETPRHHHTRASVFNL